MSLKKDGCDINTRRTEMLIKCERKDMIVEGDELQKKMMALLVDEGGF